MGFGSAKFKRDLEEKKSLKDSVIFTEGTSNPITEAPETIVDPTSVVSIKNEEPTELHVTETEVVQEVNQASSLASQMEELKQDAVSEPTQVAVLERPEVEEIKVEEPAPVQPIVDDVVRTQPSINDTSLFQRVAVTASEDSPVVDSYAEMIENMIASQCQLSGVKNLDLTTFGVRAQVVQFPNLTVLEYGKHKFLGVPFTEEEENSIVHKIGLHVATSPKDTIVIRAVQEVEDSRGLVFHSLLFNDRIAQKFVNMFNYPVYTNPNEADVSRLVMVIKKKK